MIYGDKKKQPMVTTMPCGCLDKPGEIEVVCATHRGQIEHLDAVLKEMRKNK